MSQNRFPQEVRCELNERVVRRLLRPQDADAMYGLFRGDNDLLYVIESWGYEEVPHTRQGFADLVRHLLEMHEEDEFYPYAVLDGGEMVGFDLYSEHPGCEPYETEIMMAYGARYRKRGFFQVSLYSSMRVLAENGRTSTRWVDPERNPRSWRANSQFGRLGRTVTWDGHEYDVFVVTPEEWPATAEKIAQKYRARIA